MYEVKVFDSSGNLKKVISKKDLAKRWDLMFKPMPMRKAKPIAKAAPPAKKVRKVAASAKKSR
jgi:hypothetical protein